MDDQRHHCRVLQVRIEHVLFSFMKFVGNSVPKPPSAADGTIIHSFVVGYFLSCVPRNRRISILRYVFGWEWGINMLGDGIVQLACKNFDKYRFPRYRVTFFLLRKCYRGSEYQSKILNIKANFHFLFKKLFPYNNDLTAKNSPPCLFVFSDKSRKVFRRRR